MHDNTALFVLLCTVLVTTITSLYDFTLPLFTIHMKVEHVLLKYMVTVKVQEWQYKYSSSYVNNMCVWIYINICVITEAVNVLITMAVNVQQLLWKYTTGCEWTTLFVDP